MKNALIGKKIGMTQVFDGDGLFIPVTVVQAGPCYVTQVKSNEKDGYEGVQLSFLDKKEKSTNKPQKGHFDKAGVTPKRFIKEFKLDDASAYEIGKELKADVFNEGDLVDISGISKGKGFQGGIKRHGFSIGPMAHGSKYHRSSGSLGSSASPSRVFKGKKLPGHMGSEKVTVQNLKVVKVDIEKDLLLIKGALPGINGSIVYIKNAVKSAK